MKAVVAVVVGAFSVIVLLHRLIVYRTTIKSKAAVSSGQCSADTAISSADAGLSTKPPQHLYATHHGALHLTYTQHYTYMQAMFG